MTALWVVGLLALLVLGLYVFLKLRPGWVATALERRPERRGVCVTIGASPFPLRTLFLVEVAGIPGARDRLRRSLARIEDDSDLVAGLSSKVLSETIGRPAATDTPFDGALDEPRLQRARQALADAGLDLRQLELLATRAMDATGERLARVHLEESLHQGGGARKRCPVLDFLLDGRGGLGHWSVSYFEDGVRRFGRSTEVVRRPGARLKLVPGKEGGLVFYQSLQELEQGSAPPPEL